MPKKNSESSQSPFQIPNQRISKLQNRKWENALRKKVFKSIRFDFKNRAANRGKGQMWETAKIKQMMMQIMGINAKVANSDNEVQNAGKGGWIGNLYLIFFWIYETVSHSRLEIFGKSDISLTPGGWLQYNSYVPPPHPPLFKVELGSNRKLKALHKLFYLKDSWPE